MNINYDDWKRVEADVTIRKNNETVSIVSGLFTISPKTTVCTLYDRSQHEHLVFIRKQVSMEKNHLKVQLIDGRELFVDKKQGVK